MVWMVEWCGWWSGVGGCGVGGRVVHKISYLNMFCRVRPCKENVLVSRPQCFAVLLFIWVYTKQYY